MDTKNIEKELNSFGRQVIRDSKKNLLSGGKGGGNLEESLDFKVVPNNDGFTVEFTMADYGAFVDKGVKGAGGTIKTGKHAGTYGGRRHYQTWEGKRKDSPFQYGSGKGSGSIYTGIGKFIKKKGLQPRSKGGQFQTTLGLKIAIVKVLWTKGIHGISFFQKSLNLGMKKIRKELLGAVEADIIDSLAKFKKIT